MMRADTCPRMEHGFCRVAEFVGCSTRAEQGCRYHELSREDKEALIWREVDKRVRQARRRNKLWRGQR